MNQTAPRNQPPQQVIPNGVRSRLTELGSAIDQLEKAIDSLGQATESVRRPLDNMALAPLPLAGGGSDIAQRIEGLTIALRNQRDRIDQLVGTLDL